MLLALEPSPLPTGKISFTPLAGTASPTAGATITDGKFTIESEKGLKAGKFRVEIKAMRASGKAVFDDLSGGKVEKQEQYIPARYNSNSELVAEVKEGESDGLQFALSAK